MRNIVGSRAHLIGGCSDEWVHDLHEFAGLVQRR
jgi:hypothetical protein